MAFTITFAPPPLGVSVDQVRNFAEDLCRHVLREELGDLGGWDAVDSATDVVRLHGVKSKDLGRAQALIKRLLKAHLLDEKAKVSRG